LTGDSNSVDQSFGISIMDFGETSSQPSIDSGRPLRIVFFGTAELACASLGALARRNEAFEIVAVVTQPDRPKGRDLKLQPPPVKAEAMRLGFVVLQPERARAAAFVETSSSLNADLIVVAAYGQILPAGILNLPRFGCLNVHASLLPKYRGAAPIQWAILNDEPETGVTIMKMDAGLDTGDMLTWKSTPIFPGDNSQTLHDRLAALGAELLVATIPDYVAGRIIARPQPAEGTTYARKISKEDGRLDWNAAARTLWNRIRAFTPWPGAFTSLSTGGKSTLLKIWEATIEEQFSGRPGEVLLGDKTGIVVACGQKALRILTLQREGGRRLSARDFLAGHDLKAGTKLGSDEN
jgi:methionyl-tRNA formyltransferase